MVSSQNDEPRISVVICSHNPRMDYLGSVIEGLRRQTLPFFDWELILVDSASKTPLEDYGPISWHPHHCYVRSEMPGLTHARLQGIKIVRSKLIVFVDDDNVLAPDYLSQAIGISEAFPQLGVWNGSALPVYEQEPPELIKIHQGMLACRVVLRDSWSNIPKLEEPWVFGAGMCVRREQALNYLEIVVQDPRRAALGRAPDGKLLGGEDFDMVLSVCDNGLGRGVFKSLSLDHLIPAQRCTLDYLEKLMIGNAASLYLISFLRGELPKNNLITALKRFPYMCVQAWKSRSDPEHARFKAHAFRKGRMLAKRITHHMKTKGVTPGHDFSTDPSVFKNS